MNIHINIPQSRLETSYEFSEEFVAGTYCWGANTYGVGVRHVINQAHGANAVAVCGTRTTGQFQRFASVTVPQAHICRQCLAIALNDGIFDAYYTLRPIPTPPLTEDELADIDNAIAGA